MLFNIPTKEEYQNIMEDYPFEESILLLENFQYTSYPEGDMEGFFASSQIFTWHIHLKNRMYQVRLSWVILNHLFDQGIPDDEWWISPSKDGESSVEYFPHFKEEHYLIKAQFDYFSDIFYYKIFSAWDTLGHILNNMYGLNIKRADFYKAVQELKNVRPDLYSNLNELIKSEDFEKMRGFRHSITHNELIGNISSGVGKISGSGVSGLTFGVGDYTTSAQIKENADKSLKLLTQTIEFIKEQAQTDIALSASTS